MVPSSRILLVFASLVLAGNTMVQAQDVEEVIDAPIFGLTGSLAARSSLYQATGIEDRRTPLSWTVSGSLTPTFKSLSVPMSFVVSERERTFRQPFNVVGLSPRYKWASLHLGYRSLDFSRYTLAGRQFFGAGLELKPGAFRLGAMYGRFQRAVMEDSAADYIVPAYEQSGMGLELGVETGGVKVMVSWVRAKDDTGSLPPQGEVSELTPQENNALGLDLALTLIPNHLTLDVEGGASLFTRDLDSPDLDLEESDIPAFLKNIQPLKLSTTLTFAARTGLNLTFSNWGVRFGYERIEPEYQSLGAYYFNTDVENYTVAPHISTGGLRLAGSIGLGRDNVLDQKLARTTRIIGSLNADWQPSQTFGLSGAFTNYSTGQSAGRQAINDTIAVRSVTQGGSLSPRLFFSGESVNHALSLVGGYQDFTDLNAFTREFSDNSTLTGSLSYNLTLLKSRLSIGTGFTVSRTELPSVRSDLLGVNANAGMTFLNDDALSLNLSAGATRSTTSGSVDQVSTVLSENATIGFRPSRHDNLTLSGDGMQSSSGGGVDGLESFTEYSVTLGYSRTFSLN